MSGGETAARFAAYTDTLDCVHCGLCVPHCPTHAVTGREADSPRGRIHLMRSWAEGRNELSPSSLQHLEQCIVCRGCESVCPSGIRMGEMMESFRSEVRASRPSDGPSRTMRFLLDRVLVHPARVRALSNTLELYQRLGLSHLVGKVLGPFPGLARAHALQPSVPPRKVRVLEQGPYPAEGKRRARVALFLGCIAREWFAPVHRATIRVLQRNGCEVALPPAQGCCGALHRHAGLLDEARTLLAGNRSAFRGEDFDAVVVNAAGCGASLKEPLDDLGGEPPYRDVAEFLGALGLRDPDRPLPRRVAIDEPCHLVHGQRIPRSVTADLLARIPEIRLVPLPGSERCCGAGGVFNLLHPEMAGPVLEEKVREILASEAEIVATGNPGCALQIASGLAGKPVRVAHPVELLDGAYSRAGGA